MLHSTGNSQETARLYALGSGIILVQIRALDDNDPDIARMGVHSGIESGYELSEGGVGSFICVAPDRGHGNSLSWGLLKIRMIGGDEDHSLVLLTLHSPNGPRNHQRCCCSNN